MEPPWTFFTWKDIYTEQKRFVQATLRENFETHKLMNSIVYCISCQTATRIEEQCLAGLTEAIDNFRKDNPCKEPRDCDWLDFVFHYNTAERFKQRMLDDELLKKELESTLNYTIQTISKALLPEYNLLINSRTKATSLNN